MNFSGSAEIGAETQAQWANERAMIEAAYVVVEKTHARMGYTQSDEISLVFQAPEGGDVFFNGRVQKLVSVLGFIHSARQILADGLRFHCV